jgi:hypothetical protein
MCNPFMHRQGPNNIFNLTKYDGCTFFFKKPPLSEGAFFCKFSTVPIGIPELLGVSGLTMCSSTSNSVLTSNACRSRRLLDYRHFFFRRNNGCGGVALSKEVAVASQGRYGDQGQRIRIVHHSWSLFGGGGHFERDCCAMDMGSNSAAEVRFCDGDGCKIHGHWHPIFCII